MKRCFVLAGNRITGKVSIREFEDNGRGELDFEVALDEACEDLGFDDVSWAVYYNKEAESVFNSDFKPFLRRAMKDHVVKVSKLNEDDQLWNH